jgi:signal transduction histidine kinase
MLAEVEERRQMLLRKNQELVKAKDAAESANRAKSQFLANISHELRTPLNAVIGFSDILMKEMLGPIDNKKYLEYSKDINDSGEHLLHIINDILDLSKAEAGKLEPVLREISVRKTIEECLGVISERAAKAVINIHTEIAPNMPSLVADRVMFKRILMHLLANAVKFTNKGGNIVVTANAAKDPADEHMDVFTIEVKDTGIGMSANDLDLVFNRFTQLDG